MVAAALGVLARDAQAQILFSVDYRGPTNGMPSPCGLPPLGPGDVLSVFPGAPCAIDGPAYGPLPPPDLIIMGGPGGLGVPSIGGCIGAPPGAACPRELDAISMGFDPFPTPGQMPAGFYVFSVDECSVGIPGGPLAPSTGTVASEFGPGEAAADVFEALTIPPYPMAFPIPAAMVPGNLGLVDGNGLVSPTFAHYPGVGIIEPTPAVPVAAPAPRPGDNLDALDLDVGPVPVVGGMFFSLDGVVPNPCTPGLGTAMANGFLPGAVLQQVAGGPPIVYAPPALLGRDLAGPGRDDLDALAIFENGMPGYQPSPGAYAWGPGAFDMLLFSVRRGSAVIGMIASGPIAAPIEAGDVLIPPAVAGMPPQIFIPAEYLGLATMRMGLNPMGDDLDALDTRRPPATSIGFCHGDGTLIPCPCGNVGANGNGCANSAFAAGGALTATGVASVTGDSVSLLASNMTGATCVFFQGATSIPAVVVDDGIGCVGGPVIRLGTKAIVANTSAYPTGADPIVSVKGLIPAAGATRYYQTFYRNAAAVFCPPATSNRTNGIVIVWAP
ncbi:MAG: hypothetical protein HZA53_08390 [Planctomycetes bacterium]|nr:hypothetical protein [Planctomycetota bacterium]